MMMVVVTRNAHNALVANIHRERPIHVQSAWLGRQMGMKIVALRALSAQAEGFLSMARMVLVDYTALRLFRCRTDGTKAMRYLSLSLDHIQRVTAVPMF